MKNNYPTCLAFVLDGACGWAGEGGFVIDDGGATNHGVTQATYNAYCKENGLLLQSVKQITLARCHDLYLSRYWTPANCDALASGIDLCTFDFSVNSGVGSALAVARNAKTIDEICDARLAFLQRLSTFSKYGKGWTIRVNACRMRAKQIASRSSTSAVARDQ